MRKNTSALFHRLRKRESGEAVLHEVWTAPTCARMLREELERAGISVPEWIASADIRFSEGSGCLDGISCCAQRLYCSFPSKRLNVYWHWGIAGRSTRRYAGTPP